MVAVSDRVYVDTAGLTRGGLNLGQWSSTANRLAAHMRNVTATYRHAGGTGEMGEQFDANYRPGAEKAMEFLSMLEEAVGGISEKTLLAGKKFEDTDDEANGVAPKE
ncbi:hypothetical protein SAMN02982929_03446 [Saccharopolyspora kobensis]|uniref:WXG100 family type VII secretion target n=1 Tax=Saccharopolyspora kobensis TaxID=146035 RepID=A0A1H6CSJ8_9PSEU|nr:hypothetical protein SAMN02982929_03446 [Saccharopolyspora kobensis]SFC96387.1 hypothetical protein SAMN05216506_10239 [Saccharopolyspora kobensis]